MRHSRDLVEIAAAMSLLLAACGGDADDESEDTTTPTSAAVEDTAVGLDGDAIDTVDEPSSEPAATVGTTAEPTSVFAMSAREISASVEAPTAIGTNVAAGFNAPDRELYLAQFHLGARVIDPIVPSLNPSVGAFFSSFGAAGTLCESWPIDAVYVNTGGALTAGSCNGIYRDLPDAGQLPTKPRVIRHLPISDGLATELMHRIGLEAARTLPMETAAAIGFADPERRGTDLAGQAATAEDFIDRLESAWATADPDALAQLYQYQSSRHDGFAGDRQSRQEIKDWYALLFETYPDLTLEVTEGFASGLGPGATHDLTMTAGGDNCTMRIGAVWDLDDEGLIADEYVYYDPHTVLACGWAR
ncbi:MAG: nuclear transport factor 2 family protein [Ilumatobacter sp.]|uniref:nuclear transport factor 2 family protein n=1 Tax=Ilumatobacter sp. TaxID=1967498 RepID=UPI002608E871|nr:nuclear transport factor 2 family protein [Ilumatobacter sp.]MDJ0769644.1 nuclear transport factor 2 family protein [Ilumatobacter sp.]